MGSFPYLDFFQMVNSIASSFANGVANPFRCMFESAQAMIPDNEPIKTILYEGLSQNPLTNNDLVDNGSLLKWQYRLNEYVHRQLYNAPYMDYDKFRNRYDQKNVTMNDWSHPSWKMIHYYSAKYDGSSEYATHYKAFVTCLQYLLPCSKCRDHLRTNLADHPINDYFHDNNSLFIWGYILHQTVSSQLGKKGLTLEESRKVYGL